MRIADTLRHRIGRYGLLASSGLAHARDPKGFEAGLKPPTPRRPLRHGTVVAFAAPGGFDGVTGRLAAMGRRTETPFGQFLTMGPRFHVKPHPMWVVGQFELAS